MDSVCVVCGNPEKMYGCPNEDCENFGENSDIKGDVCVQCSEKMILDKGYHKEC